MRNMNHYMKYIKRIIPDYAIIPIALMLTVNGFVYSGTRIFTDKMTHYDLSSPLDYRIPFIAVFVVPYLLAFLQWIIGYIVIAHQGKEYCQKVMAGEIISKIFVGILFIVFPTVMLRVEITGNGIFDTIIAVIYRMDAPTNLFPSIHCLESYICMRSAIEIRNSCTGYKVAMIGMSILVFLSTLFIKQHVIVDVFGAVLVAEAGRIISELYFSDHIRLLQKKEM